ncbi:condensation domain-containing protein, partial [Escherichia coli]|nr:condensation domain-containing protein [Escherichia coli]
ADGSPAAVPIEVLDLRNESEAVAAERVAEYRADDRAHGFDLLQPPLIRLAVFRMPSGADGLLLSNHLLLWDGWSHQLVLRDLFAAYQSALT